MVFETRLKDLTRKILKFLLFCPNAPMLCLRTYSFLVIFLSFLKYQTNLFLTKRFFTFLEVFLLFSYTTGANPKEGRPARIPYPRNGVN